MTAREIGDKHPMRNNKKNKLPFIADVLEYFRERGYAAAQSDDRFCILNRNIVAGNVDTAEYIFTAHYDTCLRMLVPANIVFPRHMLLTFLLQLAIMAVPSLLFFGLWQLFADAVELRGFWRFEIGWTLWFFMMVLLFFGLPNRHNVNDNTSGVRCVLEAANRIPEEYRNRAAFVLFDHEEWGLLGSAAYFLKNTQLTKPKVIVNLDCVGVGDDIFFILDKKLAGEERVFSHFTKCMVSSKAKRMEAVNGKGWFYPSDQANFIKAVGVAAFKRTRRGALYIDGIHVDADAWVDEENMELVTRALVNLVDEGLQNTNKSDIM